MTIDAIIDELQRRVAADEPISPASWIESAIRICTLSDTLDNELARLEGAMLEAEIALLKQDMTAAKAKVLSKSAVDYTAYLSLKAKIERINEFIRLAKHRSRIEDI
jgi:hypothetical protein